MMLPLVFGSGFGWHKSGRYALLEPKLLRLLSLLLWLLLLLLMVLL